MKTPGAAPAAAPGEDGPSSSASKRRKIHVDPIARDWFLDILDQWKTERRWDMPAVLVRGPAPVPWSVRRDRPRTLPTAGSGARHEQKRAAGSVCCPPARHDTAERAHHAGHRRAVPQCGDDQRPGARMARLRGTRRPSQQELGEETPAWHELELQEARQVLEGADRARGQDRRRLAGAALARSALTTSRRRTAGPRRPRSCSSRPHWTT